jgi:hypothetical protein
MWLPEYICFSFNYRCRLQFKTINYYAQINKFIYIYITAHVAEQGTSNNMQPQPSSRWSPTPVQLLVLEELYRQGMKTPSAEQIQQIASQLRQFGKIEGKNVFYWFQNHKARERQKRRRREMEGTTGSSTEVKIEKEKYITENSEKQENAGIQLVIIFRAIQGSFTDQ